MISVVWATKVTCPPSANGPIVHGGAWLTIEDTPVDVLFRDLDVIEGWLHDAERGRFEVLVQNGYIVGAPTYLPIGELAICRPIAGDVPRPEFPDALAASAPASTTSNAASSGPAPRTPISQQRYPRSARRSESTLSGLADAYHHRFGQPAVSTSLPSSWTMTTSSWEMPPVAGVPTTISIAMT
jgi:hypothetical protein